MSKMFQHLKILNSKGEIAGALDIAESQRFIQLVQQHPAELSARETLRLANIASMALDALSGAYTVLRDHETRALTMLLKSSHEGLAKRAPMEPDPQKEFAWFMTKEEARAHLCDRKEST
jgi:hypothetical protein